ncbi:MAG: SDR family NAD(P)-dependent oxidoreductase [Cyclobacteriaceae bacterium]
MNEGKGLISDDDNPEKNLVITGVSTGIGRALAEVFCGRGYRVFGSVRNLKDSEPLTKVYADKFFPLVFDVQDDEAIEQAADLVAEQLAGRRLEGLINNAGIAIGGPLEHQPLEEIRRHFEINVMGVLKTTRAFLPMLGTDSSYIGSPGRIVNVSSVSGKLADPFVGAYAGSKHALEAMSASWRQELKVYGIKLILIGPGAVRTPIWDKGIDASKYTGTSYESALRKAATFAVKNGQEGWEPAYLARKIYRVFTKRRPGRRYAFVANKTVKWTLRRALPVSLVEKITGRVLRLGR